MKTAKLSGPDLRGSVVDGLRIGLEELQGAIVDIAQAVSLLRLLGVMVKEYGED